MSVISCQRDGTPWIHMFICHTRTSSTVQNTARAQQACKSFPNGSMGEHFPVIGFGSCTCRISDSAASACSPAAVRDAGLLTADLVKGNQHKGQEVGLPPWNKTTYLNFISCSLSMYYFIFMAFQRTARFGYYIRFVLTGDRVRG